MTKWSSECKTKSSTVITGLFQRAHLKRDMNFDHRGFRPAFRRAYRVSSSRERLYNIQINMTNWLLSQVCVVHPCCVFTDVCFVLFLFCMSHMVTGVNAPLTAAQKKEGKQRQNKKHKRPSNSGDKNSHWNRDRTARHLATLSQLWWLQQVPTPKSLGSHQRWHIHKPIHPRGFCLKYIPLRETDKAHT